MMPAGKEPRRYGAVFMSNVMCVAALCVCVRLRLRPNPEPLMRIYLWQAALD